MTDTDRKLLENLVAHAAETRAFLGNKLKPERERAVCRAFLRAVGVSFNENELIAPTIEPTDVAFRDARFQVRDLLRGRKRGDDWKNKKELYDQAQSVTELVEPYSPPAPVSFASLVTEVTEVLSVKAAKYGAGCNGLDALIYVDFKNVFLEAISPIPDTVKLKHQGWRSVSFFFSPYGTTLFARGNAPSFLKDAEGSPSMKWVNINTLFEP
jgi:Putative endonuclease, protein of unknown function (DUF1780)